MACYQHSKDVHAAVAAINATLQNAGHTVAYLEVPVLNDRDERASFVEAMNGAAAGNYDTIVILGANLKYNAPADLDIESILGNIETKIHLCSYYDETAKLFNWHANQSHFLVAT